MAEKTLNVHTVDGEMETFIAHPDGNESNPVVVVYMDAPGIREELYDFARRIAAKGYYAVLPDLYYRRGHVRFDVSQMTVADREEMFGHMNSLTNAYVIEDTRSLLNMLEGEAAATGGPKGCVGYCMSGQFVMSVAGTFPEHFQASGACHGVGIVTDEPDSPHLLAPNLRGEIFFAFAQRDKYVPDGVIETLRRNLEEHGVGHAIDVYAGTEHGFCFPQRSWCYVEDAAEDVWRRSFEMWDRRLRA